MTIHETINPEKQQPMPNYSDIISRLEKATRPDRELGAQIICLQRGHRYVSWESLGTDLNPHVIEICAERDGSRFCFWAIDPTASIDAARTLVPDGWHWRLDQGRNAGAALYKDAFPQFFSVADTPAIALCIAALKARAALAGEGGE